MLEAELDTAREAGSLAARILRRYFESGVISWSKSGGEPVSDADLEADEAISSLLRSRFPDDALLTEESEDSDQRFQAARVWIVDPLDGTLDFVNGNPEFAVHIALVVDGEPILTVVEHPMEHRTYFAVRGSGAWAEEESGARSRLQAASSHTPLRVVTSRLRQSETLDRMIAHLPECERLLCGSSGLKAAMVARGACDVYFAATSKMKEWDLCAPHLLVAEAGGRCTDMFGGELRYNQKDIRALKGLCMTSGSIHEDIVASLDEVTRSLPWFRDVSGP